MKNLRQEVGLLQQTISDAVRNISFAIVMGALLIAIAIWTSHRRVQLNDPKSVVYYGKVPSESTTPSVLSPTAEELN